MTFASKEPRCGDCGRTSESQPTAPYAHPFGEGVLPLVDLLTRDELHQFMTAGSPPITRETIEAVVRGPRTPLPLLTHGCVLRDIAAEEAGAVTNHVLQERGK